MRAARAKCVVEVVEVPLSPDEKARQKANARAITKLAKAEYEAAGGYGMSDHWTHIERRIAREHRVARARFEDAGKPVPGWVLA